MSLPSRPPPNTHTQCADEAQVCMHARSSTHASRLCPNIPHPTHAFSIFYTTHTIAHTHTHTHRQIPVCTHTGEGRPSVTRAGRRRARGAGGPLGETRAFRLPGPQLGLSESFRHGVAADDSDRRLQPIYPRISTPRAPHPSGPWALAAELG